jgi:hypothetical protein
MNSLPQEKYFPLAIGTSFAAMGVMKISRHYICRERRPLDAASALSASGQSLAGFGQ